MERKGAGVLNTTGVLYKCIATTNIGKHRWGLRDVYYMYLYIQLEP
jgi:hypothetical protein